MTCKTLILDRGNQHPFHANDVEDDPITCTQASSITISFRSPTAPFSPLAFKSSLEAHSQRERESVCVCVWGARSLSSYGRSICTNLASYQVKRNQVPVSAMVMRKVGKYEVGRTIGEGTFAKVKFAQNSETGESVAMKILDKEAILKHKMVDQIKREISIMKLVRHPHVVRLHEVLASRTKIYIILEFVTGGELFDKIVHQGRLSENEARRYFQQLIDAVDYCHSKGVCHRDLKPENLLLDSQGNLKISDFGLSALPQQTRADGLLHTTCGTPNYVAPEVLSSKGYEGAVADVWSCGVICFVLMAGFLPFDEPDLATLYRKVNAAEFSCPTWFSPAAKSLIYKILEPDPRRRITIAGIRSDEWFKRNYTPVRLYEDEDVNLDDVLAVFDDSEETYVNDQREWNDLGPYTMNAFELITLSQGFNLSALFDRRQDHVKRQTRYISKCPAKEIMTKMEAAAKKMGFHVQIRGYKMRLEGSWGERGSELAVATEVFEVAPSLYLVEVRKAAGDTLDYHKFYKTLCHDLGDVVWKSAEETQYSDGGADG